jgi:hypothetical protein
MKGLFTYTRAIALLLLVALVTSGCGLFNRTTADQTGAQGAVLGRLVTAQSIDTSNKSAPVNETNTFSTTDRAIYAVVEAERIDPNTTMFARWSRDGRPFEDSQPVTADKTYQNTYVEFHLQPVNQPFDPGNYTVQIFVNGNPAQQTSFTIQ